MSWIRDIIKEEKLKHHNMPWGEEKYNYDWAEKAAEKIWDQLIEDGAIKERFK